MKTKLKINKSKIILRKSTLILIELARFSSKDFKTNVNFSELAREVGVCRNYVAEVIHKLADCGWAKIEHLRPNFAVGSITDEGLYHARIIEKIWRIIEYE